MTMSMMIKGGDIYANITDDSGGCDNDHDNDDDDDDNDHDGGDV